MTLRHRVSLRTIAAGSALGLAAAGTAVLGTAGSASAVPLDFDCTVPVLGAQTFAVGLDTDAPATAPTGGTLTPTWTADLTIPASMADLMRGVLSIDEIGGQIVSQATVDGVPSPVTLTIPRTDIGDSGAATVTAVGDGAPIPLGDPGDVVALAAGNQAVTMNLYDLDGDPAGTVFEIPCTPAAEQDLTVDSVEVVKAGSRTRADAKFIAKKKKVAATATVRPETPVPADGEVTFTLKRGSRTVDTTTAALVSGVAKASFAKVRKAGKYTLVAKYAGSTLVRSSSGKDGFTVR